MYARCTYTRLVSVMREETDKDTERRQRVRMKVSTWAGQSLESQGVMNRCEAYFAGVKINIYIY